MIIYFLRHGIAIERSEWRKKDSDRPLTDEGIRKLKKIARRMKKWGLEFDWILTSPYRRAYDTAAIVADTFHTRKKLTILKSLAADGNPQQLIRDLALNYLSHDSLLLVGHEPYLTRLVSTLIGSREPLAITLKKGGLCKLTADSLQYGPCATLEWLLTPKLIKEIA